MNNSADVRLARILHQMKSLAAEYYELTGRPVGITGEIAELEATRILDLDLAEARQAGYDATRTTPTGEERIEIKGRRVVGKLNPGARVGSLRLKHEWDKALLVLLDEQYDAYQIWEADRPALEEALTKPGSTARNERGQLSVSQFKTQASLVWELPL